jgi:hypothetical protein
VGVARAKYAYKTKYMGNAPNQVGEIAHAYKLNTIVS